MYALTILKAGTEENCVVNNSVPGMAVIHKYQHFPMLRKSTLLDTLPQSLSSKSIKENVSISLEFLLLKVYNISAQYTQRLQKTTS